MRFSVLEPFQLLSVWCGCAHFDPRITPRCRNHREGGGASASTRIAVEQERLAAGHPQRREAELASLEGTLDQVLGRQQTPLDPGCGLGQAVGAAQVAVVVRVQPQPPADAALADRGGDRGQSSPSAASRCSGAGLVGRASALQ